jgi:tripartite-type tricarboxylate transporter receptor subunit TctC
MIRRGVVMMGAVTALLHMGAAAAQDYPVREIHAISPSLAGSGIDVFVRYFAARLDAIAGKPVIVENKPGAAGLIGTEYVARAKADGYTIGILPGSSMLAAAPHVFKSVPFDPMKDFTPITTLAKVAFVLSVDPRKPIKNVTELTAYLKTKKDDGFYGTVTNSMLIAAELFKNAANVKTARVSYKDINSTLSDLQDGGIDFTFAEPVIAVEQAKAGRLRALGVTSSTRLPVLPDIPTMNETGLAYGELISWWCVIAPAGTPPAVTAKLEGWFNQIAASPATKDYLATFGAVPFPGTSAGLKAYLADETVKWGNYAKLANIEPQ